MMYVMLIKDIKFDLGFKHYLLKSGDIVKIDTKKTIAFHQEQDVCFDIAVDEYECVQ